ncbi:hypothetical protein K466DRAFT_569599 [Polyporus arcularius HHB13444]|uniref:Uncharacterized protein n=1 Tax=Polyporus arcularius HHB13444 TaxID=1314778 RepID=A0A5C3NU26_9APHY|nr:hypothetical protein K466DRAFT_569599 [Polyporus arcularius HHB13444]
MLSAPPAAPLPVTLCTHHSEAANHRESTTLHRGTATGHATRQRPGEASENAKPARPQHVRGNAVKAAAVKIRTPCESLEGGATRKRAEEDDGRNEAEEETKETTVFAWWKEFGEDHQKIGGTRAQRHVYSTTLKPTAPLDLGMSVRVVALAKGKKAEPGRTLVQYGAYDPHIVGTVTRMSRKQPGWWKVTIQNECGGNEVGIVDLEIPHAPGLTVRRRWTNNAWTDPKGLGGIPGEGQPAQRSAMRCEANQCKLVPLGDDARRTIRVRPMRGDDNLHEDLRPREEGTLAMHLWMRYDYAK